MMNLSRMVAKNRLCTIVFMSALGASIGCVAASMLCSHCCKCQTITGKIKSCAEKMMP